MIRENYKKRLEEKEQQAKEMRKENKKTKTKNNKKTSQVIAIFTDNDLIDLVNDSVRITFFRSMLTTLTTIFPVICLMILGAREIVNFNIALLVGFIAGVYSSIYISNQIWLMLEIKRLKTPKKEKKDDDDEIEEIQIKGVNC